MNRAQLEFDEGVDPEFERQIQRVIEELDGVTVEPVPPIEGPTMVVRGESL